MILRQISLVFLWCAIFWSLPCPVDGQIIHGIGIFSPGSEPERAGWDFSEQTSVPWYDADLVIVDIVIPHLGYTAWADNGARLVMIPDSTFEELTTAPADSSLYSVLLPAYTNVVYVIRTPEGHYSKFRILEVVSPVIEYAYQPDGSRILVDPVAVEKMTWGRLKVIYMPEERR